MYNFAIMQRMHNICYKRKRDNNKRDRRYAELKKIYKGRDRKS